MTATGRYGLASIIVLVMDEQPGVATAWDAEYRAGRYRGDPPVAFTRDILAAARAAGCTAGLYIGCGNGRNYLPLVAGGLDLTGLDISATAIAELTARAPERRRRLVCGDLAALPAGAAYPLVVGIQVFQHGDLAAAHAHIRAAQALVAPGGLFCIRVNATQTDIWPEHEVTDQRPDGGRTVRYLAGPKRGLRIHFFSAAELDGLFTRRFEPALAPRLQRTWRVPAELGQWSQWEAIYRSVEPDSHPLGALQLARAREPYGDPMSARLLSKCSVTRKRPAMRSFVKRSWKFGA